MNSLLFSIALSALLSVTSLLIILLRVSPITAPKQAVPALFLSLLLSVSSVATLLFFALWKAVPIHHWDGGKILSISLRQGILLSLGTASLLVFQLLDLFTWWIAILIYLVFVLIELALEH